MSLKIDERLKTFTNYIHYLADRRDQVLDHIQYHLEKQEWEKLIDFTENIKNIDETIIKMTDIGEYKQ